MLAILSHWFAIARTARQRRLAIESLCRLSDAQLLDIGIDRGTIEDHVGEALPWQAFEAEVAHVPRQVLQGCG